MIGRTFERWTVIASALPYVQPSNGKRQRRWLVRCECGTEKVVQCYSLRSGDSKSCGCLNAQRIAERRTTHGATRGRQQTPTYKSWSAMIQRCDNPNSPIFEYYGGRGIKVCERWRKFEDFLADMGERPSGTTLDRWPNNDGNYEPSNCRWATKKEQANNRRRAA